MATVAQSERSINDESFQILYNRFKLLETELNTMQNDYQMIYSFHGQQCVLSLRNSVKSFFEVIKYVNKADKALIDLHYRSIHLKGALRLVGMDRRTHVLIEKKTQKLKQKVSVVKDRYSEASGVFEDGVEATTRLRKEFVTFSAKSVGEVSKEAIQTRDTYDKDSKQVQSRITVQEVEHQDVNAEVSSTQESLTRLRERSGQAETIRDACITSSYGSFGLAAASAAAALFFPPSLAATAPLVAFGAGSASVATSYDQEVSSLELQQEELNKKLANQESSIEALKNEISSLNLEHQRYTTTLQMIEKLQDNTGVIRAEVQRTLDRLRQAKMILNRILTELEVMREQLEECQYAKTRRDIARKLREVVTSMQNVSEGDILVSDQQKVTKAMHALAEIDQKTREVVEIASLALPNSS